MGDRQPSEVLELPSGASQGELKDAYRRLALRYHPDRNRGDEAAAARFKEVSEAYAALRQAWRRPGMYGGGVARGAAPGGFAFAGDGAFAFAAPGGADTVPRCPPRKIDLSEVRTAGPGARDRVGAGGRTARRGPGLSASLCLVFGGVLVGVALPPADRLFAARAPVPTAASVSSAPAPNPAADAADLAEAISAAAMELPGHPAMHEAGGAERNRWAVPADDAPAGMVPPIAGGARPAWAEEPAAAVSADGAAAPWDAAAAAQAPARPEEPVGERVAALAEGGPAGRSATPAEHPSGDPVSRLGPPPAFAGTCAAEAAPLFAALMRTGETALQRGDVAGARARYERAAALDPASSTAAIAAGETYDPHVLSLMTAANPWLADTAKAAAWYERARALGDLAAVGLLARLR